MKLNLQVTRLQDGAKVPVHVVAAGKLIFSRLPAWDGRRIGKRWTLHISRIVLH